MIILLVSSVVISNPSSIAVGFEVLRWECCYTNVLLGRWYANSYTVTLTWCRNILHFNCLLCSIGIISLIQQRLRIVVIILTSSIFSFPALRSLNAEAQICMSPPQSPLVINFAVINIQSPRFIRQRPPTCTCTDVLCSILDRCLHLICCQETIKDNTLEL